MEFYDRVKAAAKTRDTTIEAVVSCAKLTRDSYNSYRKRGNLPRADEAVAIARALETTVEYLVKGEQAGSWMPPARIASIVEDLMVLDDAALGTVGRMVRAAAEPFHGKRLPPLRPEIEQRAENGKGIYEVRPAKPDEPEENKKKA